MKKFLVSLVLMLAVTVYTMDGKILTQNWIFINGDGVYLMNDAQANAGTLSIVEGATRILKDKTGDLKETHQHIKIIPKMWTNFIPHDNVAFVARGNKR